MPLSKKKLQTRLYFRQRLPFCHSIKYNVNKSWCSLLFVAEVLHEDGIIGAGKNFRNDGALLAQLLQQVILTSCPEALLQVSANFGFLSDSFTQRRFAKPLAFGVRGTATESSPDIYFERVGFALRFNEPQICFFAGLQLLLYANVGIFFTPTV